MLFYLFAALTAGSAVGVVAVRNVVRMAVCLLFTLTGVGGLYFLLAAEFLAAVQLVIYVGGTLILIIFGVMLTAKSPFGRLEPKRGEVAGASALGVVLLAALVLAVTVRSPRFAFPSRPLADGDPYPLALLGQKLLGEYLLPFEIASVLLLVVMIGAAYLAKGRRRDAEIGAGGGR